MEHNFKWKENGRTKLCIGLGTRPEIIRLAAVIKRAREYFDVCVIYYNQNWDKNLSTVFWEDFELKNYNERKILSVFLKILYIWYINVHC